MKLFSLLFPSVNKTPLRMYKTCVLSTLVLINLRFETLSGLCPNITKQFESPLNFTRKNLSGYALFLYKFLDPSIIQSPFYIPETDFCGPPILKIENNKISTKIFCNFLDKKSPQNVLYFNNINIIEDFEHNKLHMEYEDVEKRNFFCGSSYQMTEIYVLDFTVRTLISLYGCKEVNINGKSVKYEGVLIYREGKFDRDDEIFNQTRTILEEKIGIKWDSLNEIHTTHNNTKNYCEKSEKREIECKNNLKKIDLDVIIVGCICITIVNIGMIKVLYELYVL